MEDLIVEFQVKFLEKPLAKFPEESQDEFLMKILEKILE